MGQTTTAPGKRFLDALDGFRKKRNVSSYDVAGAVSDKEADEMLKLATSLRADVEKWIRATRPDLFIINLSCPRSDNYCLITDSELLNSHPKQQGRWKTARTGSPGAHSLEEHASALVF